MKIDLQDLVIGYKTNPSILIWVMYHSVLCHEVIVWIKCYTSAKIIYKYSVFQVEISPETLQSNECDQQLLLVSVLFYEIAA